MSIEQDKQGEIHVFAHPKDKVMVHQGGKRQQTVRIYLLFDKGNSYDNSHALIYS